MLTTIYFPKNNDSTKIQVYFVSKEWTKFVYKIALYYFIVILKSGVKKLLKGECKF